MLNDEVPDDDDFDSSRARGQFDHVTPEDLIRGSGSGSASNSGSGSSGSGSSGGNPPGWLGRGEIDEMRRRMPIAYVQIVPVRTDEFGRITQVGSLLCIADDGSVERALISGRVLFHETLREAIARNIAKDLGDIALPVLPVNLQPFTVAEFFPTPGLSEYYDPRQHAISLCYVVPIAGDCHPRDETLDVEWVDLHSDQLDVFLGQMSGGHDRIVRAALQWASM